MKIRDCGVPPALLLGPVIRHIRHKFLVMYDFWFIVTCGIILTILWFTVGFLGARRSDERRRRKMARQRAQAARTSSECDLEITQVNPENDLEITISFPNPVTAPRDRIIEYLEQETSLAVLQRYIEVARDCQAPYKTLRLIEKRITQLEKEHRKDDSITFFDYLGSKLGL